MRSSKSRSRNKSNRQRTLGNVVNRVFDSSGPEGKVRGTPQQIIEKYTALARDAQLSNDRVAEQSFLQHAEHYTRMLGEAMREQAERQQHQPQQQWGGNGNGNQPRHDDDRDEASHDRAERQDRGERNDRQQGERQQNDRQQNDRQDRNQQDRNQQDRGDRQGERGERQQNRGDRQPRRNDDRQARGAADDNLPWNDWANRSEVPAPGLPEAVGFDGDDAAVDEPSADQPRYEGEPLDRDDLEAPDAGVPATDDAFAPPAEAAAAPQRRTPRGPGRPRAPRKAANGDSDAPIVDQAASDN